MKKDIVALYGTPLNFSEKISQTPGPDQIKPQQFFTMNEEFILRIEEQLNSKGSPVTAYCTVDLPDGRQNVFISVRELHQKYGKGLTRFFTSFQFLDYSK